MEREKGEVGGGGGQEEEGGRGMHGASQPGTNESSSITFPMELLSDCC